MTLERPLNLVFETDTQQSSVSLAQIGAARSNRSLVEQLEEFKKEVEAKNRQIDAKNKELSELILQNRQLMDDVRETQEKQKLMSQELRKAEAQVELIAELIGGTNFPLSFKENDSSK